MLAMPSLQPVIIGIWLLTVALKMCLKLMPNASAVKFFRLGIVNGTYRFVYVNTASLVRVGLNTFVMFTTTESELLAWLSGVGYGTAGLVPHHVVLLSWF